MLRQQYPHPNKGKGEALRKELKEKRKIEEGIARIRIDLRSATGQDRTDLQERLQELQNLLRK